MRLAEIAEVLARHGGCRASVECETDADGLDVTLSVHVPHRGNGLAAVELLEDIQRLVDLAQIRLFVERYGVPPERLEAFLTGGK